MTELQYLDVSLGCAWDAALLEPLEELNAELLQAHFATQPSLMAQWQSLPGAARLRLARCPYLLADAGFARSEPWAALPRPGVHESSTTATAALAPALASAPTTALPSAAAPVPTRAVSRTPLPTPLMRRVLVFAWHLARSRPLAARIALGMSAPCAAAVAGWRLADLEALAEQRPAWIRVRWDDRPELWWQWLRAAMQEAPRALERMQLWGLQSLAAAVVGAAPAITLGPAGPGGGKFAALALISS